MFEAAELGHEVDKATYDAEVPALREALLDAQYDLAQAAKFPVLIVIGGVDGAGKGETVNLLSEWMDPRHILTYAFGEVSDEERERPPMWRFWRALPPKGKIGIFFGAWHTAPIVDRVYGATTDAELERDAQEVARHERMLVDEGTLILKFWFHLSKKAQKKRLRGLEKDPRTRWRVTETDWKHFELYDEFRGVSETFLRMTSTAEAPWLVVEGADARYRSLLVGRTLLAAITKRLGALKAPPPPAEPACPVALPALDGKNVLSSLDLGARLEKPEYDARLEELQGRLNLLSRKKRFRQRSVVAVFEGCDAAGKGGAIRRVTQALDARRYRVVPTAAPTEEERAQPYLWRFWRHVPRLGRVAIFDRSWYGRVLVERVEGFCKPADWARAYGEIEEFEGRLLDRGTILAKFWLQLSKEEQLARFKAREETRFKRFKITEEDWRNRERWDLYEAAVCDMVERTSTARAPWTLVAAEDKLHARIAVLETLCAAIEAGM